MRSTRDETGTKLWVSARETREWASRPGSSWPCSTLAGISLFAEFDSAGDLVDTNAPEGVNGVEFDALTSFFLVARYGQDHPAIR